MTFITGIDVEQVTVVVNFDLPLTQDFRPDFETYLHRIGRTGRFGKKGLAINMVDGRQTYSTLKQIEKYFGNFHMYGHKFSIFIIKVYHYLFLHRLFSMSNI
jgi:superfamily II DNA/RNA helicase